MQDEIDKAFAGIRALCAGERVAAPPRYYDDEDPTGMLDLHRGIAWVLHAISAPDVDGDNVMSTTLYRTGLEEILIVPNVIFSYEEKEGPAETPWSLNDIFEGMKACENVLREADPRAAFEDGPAYQVGRAFQPNPKLGEEIVVKLRKHLDKRGRLDGDGTWPQMTKHDVLITNLILNELVGYLTDDKYRVKAVNRKDGVSAVAYPTRVGPNVAASLREAAFAMQSLGDAVSQIGRAYNVRQQHFRDVVAAEKKAEANERLHAQMRDEMREKFGAQLAERGGSAETAILTFLTTGERLPVMKGSAKRPTPKRDALIDDLEDFLGDGAFGLLMGLISSDGDRKTKGLNAFSEALEIRLGQDTPRPE